MSQLRPWLLLLLGSTTAIAGPRVTIEKATVPWDSLVELIREEGRTPPRPVTARPPPSAPLAYSVPSVDVTGEVSQGLARLTIALDVEVLEDRWTVVPLLPDNLAVSRAEVDAPPLRRGMLVRSSGVALAAEGAGRYRAVLQVEGALERTADGARLSLPLREIAFGSARLTLAGTDKVSGASAWKVKRTGGALIAEAALGGPGLELILADAPARASSVGALEELEAVTVVSLGGTGVGRIRFHATPADGQLELELPPRSQLWRVYVGDAPLQLAAVETRPGRLRIPMRRSATVEVAWTFETAPMGIRGRYRVQLPRLPMPIRGASWQLYLPEGLRYSETQAALSPVGSCAVGSQEAQTPLQPDGACFAFQRTVLEPGGAWVEGSYAQQVF